MIKVDKHIPAPTGRGKYPWEEMKPGDSFFIPGKTSEDLGGAVARRRSFGEKHTTRTVTEGGVKGIRIWRIK